MVIVFIFFVLVLPQDSLLIDIIILVLHFLQERLLLVLGRNQGFILTFPLTLLLLLINEVHVLVEVILREICVLLNHTELLILIQLIFFLLGRLALVSNCLD